MQNILFHKFGKFFLATGYLIISSITTAKYIEKELEKTIINATVNSMKNPLVQLKFEELSEKIFLRMFDDRSNQTKFAIFATEVISSKEFSKYTDELSTKVLKSGILLDATGSFLQRTASYIIREYSLTRNTSPKLKN